VLKPHDDTPITGGTLVARVRRPPYRRRMNTAQADTLSKQIQLGVDEGARVALRGTVEGTMASPTVFADVKPGMSVAQCEMFGPIGRPRPRR
jgi:acyl-CoA reductase-like NAD-dependent aldehyde dehydrogenase